jgi:hypothetical protein
MLREYTAGEFVPAGTYVNRKTWEWVATSEHGDYLAGEPGVIYYRVPILLALGLGPLIGLAFILFLPLAVPALAVYTAAKVIGRNIPVWRTREAKKGSYASR